MSSSGLYTELGSLGTNTNTIGQTHNREVLNKKPANPTLARPDDQPSSGPPMWFKCQQCGKMMTMRMTMMWMLMLMRMLQMFGSGQGDYKSESNASNAIWQKLTLTCTQTNLQMHAHECTTQSYILSANSILKPQGLNAARTSSTTRHVIVNSIPRHAKRDSYVSVRMCFHMLE